MGLKQVSNLHVNMMEWLENDSDWGMGRRYPMVSSAEQEVVLQYLEAVIPGNSYRKLENATQYWVSSTCEIHR